MYRISYLIIYANRKNRTYIYIYHTYTYAYTYTTSTCTCTYYICVYIYCESCSFPTSVLGYFHLLHHAMHVQVTKGAVSCRHEAQGAIFTRKRGGWEKPWRHSTGIGRGRPLVAWGLLGAFCGKSSEAAAEAWRLGEEVSLGDLEFISADQSHW